MKHDITIIGAGIVGLAAAYKILEKQPDVKLLIIDKEDTFARHQTGNNSGVIHSGIYYKPGSLKAENCRKGYKVLLDFCDENGIQYDICGKIIVATTKEELPMLDSIYNRGIENGLENLKLLSESELKEYEPNVNGIAGIYVPQTGIIDFVQVCRKLVEILKSKNCEFVFNEKVTDIKRDKNVFVITENRVFETEKLVTCAGLYSDRIAKMTQPDLEVQIIPFRGEYYKLTENKKNLVKNLIYPVPDPNFPFLGVHFTRMINRDVEAGPNAVFAFKREGYNKFDFDFSETLETFKWAGFRKVALKYWVIGLGEYVRSFSKTAFVKALQKLIPAIRKEDLIPGGAGIRAQACSIDGKLLDDFYFVEQENILHVCNAPSPAATSSLAIGEHIADKITKGN